MKRKREQPEAEPHKTFATERQYLVQQIEKLLDGCKRRESRKGWFTGSRFVLYDFGPDGISLWLHVPYSDDESHIEKNQHGQSIFTLYISARYGNRDGIIEGMDDTAFHRCCERAIAYAKQKLSRLEGFEISTDHPYCNEEPTHSHGHFMFLRSRARDVLSLEERCKRICLELDPYKAIRVLPDSLARELFIATAVETIRPDLKHVSYVTKEMDEKEEMAGEIHESDDDYAQEEHWYEEESYEEDYNWSD